MPGALERLPGAVRSAFEHAWAPIQMLAQHIGCLPSALWEVLLAWDTGFVILVAGESRYEPGPVSLHGQQLKDVAFISLEDLVSPGGSVGRPATALECGSHAAAFRHLGLPLHVIGHLVDHHLGCGGEEQGAWLSEGGGVTPAWHEAGQRLARLFGLGYGIDEVAQSNTRDYFAQSLSVYCHNRQALNVADPQISKWLRSTLWNPAFWSFSPLPAGGMEGPGRPEG
jgi:hypothetical protein